MLGADVLGGSVEFPCPKCGGSVELRYLDVIARRPPYCPECHGLIVLSQVKENPSDEGDPGSSWAATGRR